MDRSYELGLVKESLDRILQPGEIITTEQIWWDEDSSRCKGFAYTVNRNLVVSYEYNLSRERLYWKTRAAIAITPVTFAKLKENGADSY